MASDAALSAEFLPALLRERIARRGEPALVAIWGASASGASAFEALADDQKRLALVVDSDPRRQGTVFAGQVTVLPPERLADARPDLVVIASTSPEAVATISARLADDRCTADVVSWLELMNEAAVDAVHVYLGLDRPRDGVVAHTRLEVGGWAAAGPGIASIDLLVDGRARGRAEHGRPRPDVAAMFPRIDGAAHSGFWASLDVSDLPRGRHTLGVCATGSGGSTASCEIEFTASPRVVEAPAACPACDGRGLRRIDIRVNDDDVYECARCGMATVSPVPDEARCREIYNDPETYASIVRSREVARSSPVHPDAAYIAGLLRTLHPRGHAPESLHVLEVGCANGRLLNGLKHAGFNVAGIEVSERTAAVAREELGLDVRAGMLGELPLPRRYDALVLRHVIEHVGDPSRLMRTMHGALAHDAVLVLVTPNWQSMAARVLGPRWEWFIPPLHLHYFTGTSLAELGKRTCFELGWIASRQGDARPLELECEERAAGLSGAGEIAQATRLRIGGALGAFAGRAVPAVWSRWLLGEELVTVFSRR